jgi:membrane fusion protein (multidrug efflux system)
MAERKRRQAGFVMLGALLAVLAVGILAHLRGRGEETTDDAQVEGRVIPVAPRVSGQVRRVLVGDNERVTEGQALVELDTADLDVRLRQARADLLAAEASLELARAQQELARSTVRAGLRQARGGVRQARSGVEATDAQVSIAEAEVSAAEARERAARADLERVRTLATHGASSPAELDARSAQFEQAEAARRQAEARLLGARSGRGGSVGALMAAQGRMLAARAGDAQLDAAQAQVSVAEARVEQARAAVAQAELARSYASIRAPAAGVVSRRNVEVGMIVGPERPLLAIVPADEVWLVANFKESQLAGVHPGERARVRVDTYGRRVFWGHVESLASATGSRFALLPPDNASGNFVKVAQRVPVLVRLDAAPGVPLRPGMSAEVTVFTGGAR